MDLEAESGNKEYMNQRTVYERFHIWTEFFFCIKKKNLFYDFVICSSQAVHWDSL